MCKIIFIATGTLSLCLGVLGIFLPLLPTTPFLLLSAFCYMRSSDKLYHKLMQHEILGTYIRNFQEQKAIPLRVKITSVTVLWLTTGCSAFLWTDKNWIRILLLIISIGVTVHILSYRTLENKDRKTDATQGKQTGK